MIMSRVHDALKKAEEEKAIRGDTESVVETKAPPAPALHPLEKTRVPASPRPAAKAETRTRQDELLPESFVEQCVRRNWNWDPALTQSVDSRRHTIVSEEFRTLRSQLYLMRKVRLLHKLLVTSPLPGEGKTFVAANLARVIAKQADSRVLLIDSDMRLPSMHTVLGAPIEPGLGEYLGGKYELTSVIQRGQPENFFFIPGGRISANPTELLANGRLELLMAQATPVFDWIIIDSPPTIPVSDARLLAGLCDGLLMVINAGTTPFDLAQRACREFVKGQLLGVVLNRVEPEQNYGSYYYYGREDHHPGNGKGAKV
jgi:capsular exopolysaccharide synthesis family protein